MVTIDIRRGKYVLRSDRWCYWIDEEYIGKKGNLVTKNVSGYYPDLKQLADGLARHSLGESEATSMRKLVEDAKKVNERIAKMAYKKVTDLDPDWILK